MTRSAEFEVLYPLSVADAWIAACAADQGAVLLHKDPEFGPVAVLQEQLPLTARKAAK